MEVGARALEAKAVKWKLGACEPIGVCEGELELRSWEDEEKLYDIP